MRGWGLPIRWIKGFYGCRQRLSVNRWTDAAKQDGAWPRPTVPATVTASARCAVRNAGPNFPLRPLFFSRISHCPSLFLSVISQFPQCPGPRAVGNWEIEREGNDGQVLRARALPEPGANVTDNLLLAPARSATFPCCGNVVILNASIKRDQSVYSLRGSFYDRPDARA